LQEIARLRVLQALTPFIALKECERIASYANAPVSVPETALELLRPIQHGEFTISHSAATREGVLLTVMRECAQPSFDVVECRLAFYAGLLLLDMYCTGDSYNASEDAALAVLSRCVSWFPPSVGAGLLEYLELRLPASDDPVVPTFHLCAAVVALRISAA
jgi:hypothetical protein